LIRLIVTADDFGSSERVNEAVAAAHLQGVVTSASLMVGAPAAAEAIALARRLPRLRVGLHLTVVDGFPTLPPHEIPSLVDARGRLPSDLLRAGVAMFVRSRRDLRKEIRAQFEAFSRTGLPLDHLNAHHHMHLHPTVSRLAIEIGREFGLRSVRVPSEPQRVLARTGDVPKGAGRNRLLGLWLRVLRGRLRRAGLRSNDHVFGLAWTGGLSEARILSLIPELPQGLNELYCHPAADETGELQALTSPSVRRRIEECGVDLTTFSDVHGP
jgi:hopanoid biosynthesis associated protein HpnK